MLERAYKEKVSGRIQDWHTHIICSCTNSPLIVESSTQGSIAVCTQPSCVGLNQASQLFSQIANSVDNQLPI